MVERRHSLAFRIMLLAMTAIFLSVVIIGLIGISAVKHEGDSDSSHHMNLLCDNCSKALNEFLMSVEQSASLVARYAQDDISSVKLMQGGVLGADGKGDFAPAPMDLADGEQFEQYLQGHIQRVLEVFRSTANHTRGVYTYYYTLNPQLSGRTSGFWFAKNGQNAFAQLEMTDLSEYSEEDEGHVKWYYEPLHNGRHTWLRPYRNENLDEELISYIIPIYKAGTFIGIVGMDIRYDTLTDLVRDITVYDTGYACLALDTGEIVYHPKLDAGNMQNLFSAENASVIKVFQTMDGTGETTIPYAYNGENKELAFNTLANGLKLIVVAPSDEINADWQNMIREIILGGVVLLFIFAFAMWLNLSQIITPLERLTEASRHLAAGNFDVELDYNRPDEVGVLTDSFKKLTENLKLYINDLNSRAYRDALTGVRNKGAFIIFTKKLDDAIERGTIEDFAIAMLDCDNLKRINDSYGHEKGDLYLQNACRLICETFSHCPVFRIGGDEFVAVLQGSDFDRRQELLKAFDANSEAVNREAKDPWRQVMVSKGIAVYAHQEGETSAQVLKLADADMYRNKKLRKQSR